MSGETLPRFALVPLLLDFNTSAGRTLVVRVARNTEKTRGGAFSRCGHSSVATNVGCTVHNDDSQPPQRGGARARGRSDQSPLCCQPRFDRECFDFDLGGEDWTSQRWAHASNLRCTQRCGELWGVVNGERATV